MVRTGSATRPLRFLGRERELEQIRTLVEAAVSGHGGLVLVTGPAGIGLTSLVREAAAQATTKASVGVAWGKCLPGTTGRPFSGLADALESHALTQQAADLLADLAADAGPILRICPALSPMVPSLAPAAPLDAAEERLRLYEAVADWLRRAASRQPMLVVIDDGANASDDLIALVAHVSRRLDDAPVLLLFLTPTPDTAGPLHDAAVETIEVGPLDEGAVAGLIVDRASEPVSPDVVALINDVSGGNPLLAIELFELLIEQGASASGSDVPRRESLPATLEEVIAWRAAPMTGDARAALETVALIPQGAAPSLVGAVLRFGKSRAIVALETAAEHGFLDVDTDRGVYVVDQPAVRTAVGSLMADGLAVRVHRAIATGIEEDEPDRLRERAGELCFHWHAAAGIGGGQRGVHFALLAAEQARATYAHRRVVDCLEAALALAPESDAGLRLDLLGRLATSQAAADMREEALATATRLLDETPGSAPMPGEVLTAAIDTVRALRGTGVRLDEAPGLDKLRIAVLNRASRAEPIVRSRLDLLGERWAETDIAGLRTLVWSDLDPSAVRALLEGGNEPDGGEVMLAQRPRTQTETAQAIERGQRWRRPQSVLRAMNCVVVDLVWRHGMFSEGAARAAEYLSTAERYGSYSHRAAAHLLMARARAALGEFAAADEAIGAAGRLMQANEGAAELEDQRSLAEAALAYYRDGNWAAATVRDPDVATPAGLLFGALSTLADAREKREAEARAAIANLLDAIAQQSPLTLYREPALTVSLAAAWEMGAAEHAGVGGSLVALAAEGGAGGQIESSLTHARARTLALAGDVPAARDLFANERPALDRAGQRPLRAIVDHDEAIAIAAAGKESYLEATRLLETAASQFEQLGMSGWLKRTRDLISQGLDVASGPGGRLSFTYPRGLTRREADVVRLIVSGATEAEAAAALVLEPQAVGRLLSSALEKLGAEREDELPRLARRYGLGGV